MQQVICFILGRLGDQPCNHHVGYHGSNCNYQFCRYAQHSASLQGQNIVEMVVEALLNFSETY